jgi:hypothetical protein
MQATTNDKTTDGAPLTLGGGNRPDGTPPAQQPDKYHAGRRRHKRLPVKWPARLELGGSSVVMGTVRDWSPGGMCFEPEAAYLDGTFVRGLELLAEFAFGDPVEVCYVRPEDGEPNCAPCEVRWKGWSQAHGCPALGVERVAP